MKVWPKKYLINKPDERLIKTKNPSVLVLLGK